jgi:hypothetical protein
VVVARAERRENERCKHDQIRPAFAGIRELDLSGREHCDQAPNTHQGERKVGDHIAEIGNAEPGALIGEVVVRERLWNWRKQDRDDRDYEGRRDQQDGCLVAGSHLLVKPEIVLKASVPRSKARRRSW